MIRQLLLSLCLLLTTTPIAALDPSPITLHLSPLVGYRPLTVTARITVEPHYLNRAVCVQWVGEPLEGQGCWQVEGQYAPRTHYYEIKDLPAGNYKVVALVYRVRESKHSVVIPLRVLDSSF